MTTQNTGSAVRKPVGRPRVIRYTHLALEVSRLTGVDKVVVQTVLDALPKAVLAMFDRGDRKLSLRGLGHAEYRYRHGDSSDPWPVNRESRWQFVIRPIPDFHRKLRALLGRPVKFRETYLEGIARRRQLVADRCEEVGITPKFNDKPEK